MKNEYLELKSERELGVILSDTFRFVQFNLKPLLTVVGKSAAVPFIIVIFGGTFYTFFQPQDPNNILSYSSAQIITYFINLIAGVIFYLLMTSGVLHYMRAYADKSPELDLDLISKKSKASALYLLGYGFITVILFFLGFLVFILPGIYLFVPLSIGYVILIFERKPISKSLSAAFKLISGEWWVTFGTLLAVTLVITLISLTFQLPLWIYYLLKPMLGIETFSLGNEMALDPIQAILTLFATGLSYLSSFLSVIATTLIYLDLKETKTGTGLLERIEKLGNE